MYRLYLLCWSFLVVKETTNASSQNAEAKNMSFGSCILPPHPSSGWWSYIDAPSHLSPGMQVPTKSILKIHCEDTYKLDGCTMVVCINGTWIPDIGQCLKTCPSINSTSTVKVTCNYKGQETVNCTEPIEETLAQFRCASFYEDTRLSKSKALCVNGSWSENVPECSPICGRVIIRKKPTLIVHGNKTKTGEFPWQIAIYRAKDRVLICGGSLLSERVVLTAAHCIADDYGNIYSKDKYILAAGKHYRKFNHTEDQNDSQVSEIHDMFISDKYEGDDQNFEGDIAIIVTKISFQFSYRIQPVCIDWSRQLENVVFGSEKQKGYISGWGNTKENSEPANELTSLAVPSITRKECRNLLPEEYRRYMTHDKFCAGYRNNGTSVCGGDSGGGLVFKKHDRFFIAGVVSLAPLANAAVGGCDTQQYTLYTLVYNYTDNFILQKLAKFKSSDIGHEVCRSCTTMSSTTTEATPGATHAPGECILPRHPEFGRWSVLGRSSELSPGNYVQPGTIIAVTCDKTYKYDKLNFVACFSGKWSNNIGRCQKTCPSFHNLSEIKAICTYQSKNMENCIEPVEGTIAKFKCNNYYELSSLDVRPSVCVNGKWSFVPKCVLVCGKKNSTFNTPVEYHPWHVSVYKRRRNPYPYCGGTLITTQIVITSANCITYESGDLQPKENFNVTVGNYHQDFNHTADVHVQFSETRQLLIPEFYKGDVQNYLGDIGIIIVEKPFILSGAVQLICIDWSNHIDLPLNKTALVRGSYLNQSSWTAKEYSFKIVSEEECMKTRNHSFSKYVTYGTSCAFINSDALCKAFNGQGLVIKEQGRYYLKGILTLFLRAPGDPVCSTNETVLYTKTAAYVDDFIQKAWIKYPSTSFPFDL